MALPDLQARSSNHHGHLQALNRFDPPSSGYRGGKEEEAISSDHAITEDIVFDLVSIQYHALHGQHLYKKYLEDAPQSEHPEVAEFIRDCQRADELRANRCHELLKDLTADTDTG